MEINVRKGGDEVDRPIYPGKKEVFLKREDIKKSNSLFENFHGKMNHGSRRLKMSKYKRYVRAAVLGIIAASIVGLSSYMVWSQEKEFAGVTLDVQVHAGHKQLEPIWERIPEFERQTGMKINLIRAPWADIYPKVLRDVKLGGHKYDIVEVSEAMSRTMIPYVAPIGPLLKEEGVDVKKWINQWSQFSRQYFIYEGEVVFYPFYTGAQTGYYRKSLLEDPKEKEAFKKQFGYELQPPRTMQELLDIARFFTRDLDGDGETDLWGLVIPGDWDAAENIFEDEVFRAGLRLFDEKFNWMWGPAHPENNETIEKIAQYNQDLVRKWKVTPSAILGMGDIEAIQWYLDGRAAMVMTWLYFAWKDVISAERISQIGETGDFLFPSWKSGAGGFGSCWVRAINKNTPDKKAAFEFLKWANSDENILLALREGPGAFVPASIAAAKIGADEELIPPACSKSFEVLEWVAVRSVPVVESCRNILRRYHESLLMGQITPKEFVTRTGKEAQQLLKEAGVIKD